MLEKMINQERGKIVRYSLIKALTVTVAVALGLEISGIIHQDYWKIFSFEYAVVLFISFFVSAFVVWLKSIRTN